jgi:hypothetical protein
MLIDVKRDNPVHCIRGKRKELVAIAKECGDWKLWKIKRGFYHAGLNVHMFLEDTIKEEFPLRERWWIKDLGDILPSSYGVCDSPEQLMRKAESALEASKHKMFVTFYKVSKCREPKHGGWRWHKWGPYIGIKHPRHEHIADENGTINTVYCFMIREAK